MIELYTGVPGSGKSLHLVTDIKKALKGGKTVVCNFDFRYDLVKHSKGRFIRVQNEDLTYPTKIYEIVKEVFDMNEGRVVPNSVLLVLDEVQIIFDARHWDSAGRREWNEFFSIHRKLGLSVILVTQSADSLDKRIRGNVELVTLHRNFSRMGGIGLIFALLMGGQAFIAISKYVGTNAVVDRRLIRGSKRSYRYYDSYNVEFLPENVRAILEKNEKTN